MSPVIRHISQIVHSINAIGSEDKEYLLREFNRALEEVSAVSTNNDEEFCEKQDTIDTLYRAKINLEAFLRKARMPA